MTILLADVDDAMLTLPALAERRQRRARRYAMSAATRQA